MTQLRQYAHAIDVLWVLLLAGYVLGGTWLVPFHGDESTHLSMSKDYGYQFLQGDLDRVRFQDDPVNPGEQYLRLINGSINKYTIGAAWHAAGLSLDDVNPEWAWEEDWDYNLQVGNLPSDRLLQAARVPSSLFTALGVAAMFALGFAVGGRPVAYLSSAYWALNPAVLINGRRAMSEGSMMLFGMMVVLVGLWLLRHRSWWAAALLGVMMGLAVAAKHTNIITVLVVFGVCVAAPMFSRKAEDTSNSTRIYAGKVVFAGLLSLGVFMLLNPVWWGGNPLEKGVFVLGLRQALLQGQIEMFGGYAGIADQASGFFTQALVNLPMYYEAPGWSAWIAEQVVIYERSLWSGISLGGTMIGAIMLLVFMSIGTWALVTNSTITRETRVLIGSWSVLMLLFILLLTPLEWQRYYLPVYPVIGVLAGLGVTYVARLASSWNDRRRKASSDPL